MKRYILLIAIFITNYNSLLFADDYSYNLLSKYIGETIGELDDGSPCSLKIENNSWHPDSLSISVFGEAQYFRSTDNFWAKRSSDYGASDDANIFKSAGNLLYYYNYIEAKTGGHVISYFPPARAMETFIKIFHTDTKQPSITHFTYINTHDHELYKCQLKTKKQ